MTLGGKVGLEDSRVRTETAKLAERRAVTMGRPMLPDAPITRTFLMGEDILREWLSMRMIRKRQEAVGK